MKRKNKQGQQRPKTRTSQARPKGALTGEALEQAVNGPLRASFDAIRAAKFAEAESIARDAIKQLGRHPRLFSNLVVAVENQNRPEDALRVAEAGVKSFPEDANLWNVQGAVLKFLGRIDEAKTSFARAIELAPNFPGAWRNHAGLKRYEDAEDPDLPAMEKLLTSLPRDNEGRAPLYFALARAHDQIGNTERAFELFERGNRVARRSVRFDPKGVTKVVDEAIESYGKDWLGRGPVEGASTAAPILIVGMPRCGSTLVEQVLASHPDVAGLGEIPELPLAIRTKADAAGVLAAGHRGLVTLDDKTLAAMGHRYAKATQQRAGGDTPRITDKYLTNYLHAGVVPRILPNARIIDVRRDARDNAWGCYKVNFTSNVPYSYEWSEMALVMRESRRLMDHLGALLPDTILRVQYEDMVEDIEGQTRRLLDFLGLEWSDACLRFHETKRQVNSASALQVREPLYRSSLGAWKPYEKHLGPMLKAVEGL